MRECAGTACFLGRDFFAVLPDGDDLLVDFLIKGAGDGPIMRNGDFFP